MDQFSDATTVFLLAAAVVGVLAGWWRYIRPRWKSLTHDVRAGRDALVGREAITDSITGKELQPALPGIGVRMANQEQQMAVLTEAVAKIAETHADVDDLKVRVKALEDGAVERILARAESAQAWAAVEAAVKAAPPEDSPELP